MVWLITIVLCGDMWALSTFAIPFEVGLLSVIAVLFGNWWINRLPDWNGLGHATWTLTVLSTGLYLIYNFAVTIFTPLYAIGFILSCLLFALELFAFTLALTFTFETLDECTRIRWQRRFGPAKPIEGYAPKVSLHVPAYNEPPEIVEATLRSLARLDYPNFEVLLVDNNTPNEATWRPLEAICRELGPRFKCLHLDRWPGYKSGALNFALTQTAPDAEIIGVIDADYQVLPQYLRETVPYFANERVAFLQTPQDYREYAVNDFSESSYNAYKYFFEVSMPSRNERNAIIFGGTMGLLRKSVLQQIGGWDEWCITEDAEASLRILKRGYESIYINRSYGRGLMPLNYEGLKKQRFRWCFGGIQILRKHWEALMPWSRQIDPSNRLTLAQRYYYLMGGLQWFNEVLTLIFTVLLLFGGFATLAGQDIGLRPLAGAMIGVPFVLLILGLWRFGWALRESLHLSWRRALQAMGNFFSLSWVVTLGCIQGLIQPRGVFLRTPKSHSKSGLLRALRVTQWESSLGATCAILAVAIIVSHPIFTTVILAALLLWQASLYLSAPAYSLISVRSGPSVQAVSRGDIQGRFVLEGRAARWSLLLGLLVALLCGLLRFLPEPTQPPLYADYQPEPLQLQQLVGAPALPTATPRPTATEVATPLPTATSTLFPTATPTKSLAPTSTPTPQSTDVFVTPTSTPLPTNTSIPPSPVSDTVTPTAYPTATPTPRPTATSPRPTQVPTRPPLPTRVPTQRPKPTQPPLPTQVPTQPPKPTQPPAPTQAPTQPPKPTQPPVPTPRPHIKWTGTVLIQWVYDVVNLHWLLG
jgi:cellulose synthase/poly-beta-1,6-N-acetylglucosamine synthase-like glycosyltransferase